MSTNILLSIFKNLLSICIIVFPVTLLFEIIKFVVEIKDKFKGFWFPSEPTPAEREAIAERKREAIAERKIISLSKTDYKE